MIVWYCCWLLATELFLMHSHRKPFTKRVFSPDGLPIWLLVVWLPWHLITEGITDWVGRGIAEGLARD